MESSRRLGIGQALADTVRAAKPASDQLAGFAGDPNFMLSLARGLTVLEAFSERKRPLTISQVAQRTQLSRASVRRCLYTLEQLGYVSQQDGQFALRPRVLHLGHAYFSSTSLVSLAQPILDGLSTAIRETCALAILDDTDILYLVRSEVQRVLTFSLGMGSRLPAYCTSIGRLLLAHQPPAALEAFFARAELRPRTMQTKVARADLEASFVHAREQDFVLIDEELEPGLRAIAVPVRSVSGTVLAGISVSVRAEQVTEAEMVGRLLPPMREAAAAIGKLIAA
ncbi:IclR family transcriptional regulator [Cupriavidus sp. USMAA2-4]|uniref:IclR family transcriptional regulator n=1 Tax=Cupriavidus malaysiensis TaxID=367825 RepID=A0ABN4TM31_9BURK|nr:MULTISPECIES: IclR family transcriptional regulator C-terminal domain-containing protein [Cupriavidus]AOY95209.1 IclR family transcriptional regulator [Cupriavidus sp. USMAA2-4]AOZ01891.1 IclR family transcriptional regulator [Cupriavidus sp. USMAHM13]AOZ08372.1 IclR family transcriptional regulator [Cupriavidus malaysiensis]